MLVAAAGDPFLSAIPRYVHMPFPVPAIERLSRAMRLFRACHPVFFSFSSYLTV
jgi:hypothetical protein